MRGLGKLWISTSRPELGARLLHQLGELRDGELLGELVEDAELAQLGGVVHCELDALERVADVETAAGLAALPVDGERVADHGLHAEAVEDGAEDLVVVEARHEPLIHGRLVRLDAVDEALVEVGRAQAPDAAGEVDVVRVVDLGQVVERARELRERQRVAAALVWISMKPSSMSMLGVPYSPIVPSFTRWRSGRGRASRTAG